MNPTTTEIFGVRIRTHLGCNHHMHVPQLTFLKYKDDLTNASSGPNQVRNAREKCAIRNVLWAYPKEAV